MHKKVKQLQVTTIHKNLEKNTRISSKKIQVPDQWKVDA